MPRRLGSKHRRWPGAPADDPSSPARSDAPSASTRPRRRWRRPSSRRGRLPATHQGRSRGGSGSCQRRSLRPAASRRWSKAARGRRGTRPWCRRPAAARNPPPHRLPLRRRTRRSGSWRRRCRASPRRSCPWRRHCRDRSRGRSRSPPAHAECRRRCGALRRESAEDRHRRWTNAPHRRPPAPRHQPARVLGSRPRTGMHRPSTTPAQRCGSARTRRLAWLSAKTPPSASRRCLDPPPRAAPQRRRRLRACAGGTGRSAGPRQPLRG